MRLAKVVGQSCSAAAAVQQQQRRALVAAPARNRTFFRAAFAWRVTSNMLCFGGGRLAALASSSLGEKAELTRFCEKPASRRLSAVASGIILSSAIGKPASLSALNEYPAFW